MRTQAETLSLAAWIHTPEDAVGAPAAKEIKETSSLATWIHPPDGPMGALRVLDEFVELVKGNPKVWAVCATQDASGIHVWTYVDSADREDRSLVYKAEWQILSGHPDILFDFNVILLRASDSELETDGVDYMYKR